MGFQKSSSKRRNRISRNQFRIVSKTHIRQRNKVSLRKSSINSIKPNVNIIISLQKLYKNSNLYAPNELIC